MVRLSNSVNHQLLMINVTMGEKRQEKVSQNPGPGEYDQDASKILHSKMGSVRIGTAERKDIWEDQVRAA